MPYRSMEEVPPNLKELDGARLSLEQANAIAAHADGMKDNKEIDSPYAIAITSFKQSHKIEGEGADKHWVKKKKALDGELERKVLEHYGQEQEIVNPPKLQALKEILGAVYRASKRQAGVTRVWKSRDGARWYVAAISKAVIDREGELVTEQGMDFSIALARKFKIHSGLYVQHVVPQTRIGQSVYETRMGPYWIEIGKFRDESWLADAMFKRLQTDEDGTCRLSVGFITPQRQAKRGVYTKLFKYDTSIVDKPACPQTRIMVGGKAMSDQIMKLLDPQTDEERQRFAAALKELLGVDKSVEAVEKQEDKGDKKEEEKLPAFLQKLVKLAGEMEGDMQKACNSIVSEAKAFLKKPPPPSEEEEEEVEVEAEAKKKEVESTVDLTGVEETLGKLEAKLAELSGSVAAMQQKSDDGREALDAQVKHLGEQVAEMESQSVLAGAFAELVKRMPAESFHKPSEQAGDVDEGDVDEVLKALGAKAVPAHPLAGFAGAPGSEGEV